MAKSKKGWAVVTKTGSIDIENIRPKKSDVNRTIFDEETGAKVRRVIVTVVE